MLIDILWPAAFHLRVDHIEVSEGKLVFAACGIQEKAYCPDCREPSERINSHYCRHPADLSCGGYDIRLNLRVPRFFCDNETCSRQTFAATFPELLQRYARRTTRLRNQQRQVGYVVGGEAGCRLVQGLGMGTSADTLIRLVRDVTEPEIPTPRVLGVDDWAKCKGQSYGTILVDLEKHVVVDLLEDRSAESLSQWLKEHPGVEIITRDRGADYIEGATTGAPEAVQIADRFHLLQNIVDTLKRMLERQTNQLRQAARDVAVELQDVLNQPLEGIEVVEVAIQEAKQPPTLRQLHFEEVKQLQEEGWSQRAITKHLGIDRRTVRKYFSLDNCPERPSMSQSTSTVTPYLGYLSKRWQEGCQNIKQLHTELEGQGFTGHYASVYRAVKRLLANGQVVQLAAPVPVPIPKLSVTQAAWLLLHPDERLEEMDCKLRDKLCEISEEIKTARELAQSFCTLIRTRAAEKLDDWLTDAKQSGIQAFKNFAVSLCRDYDAVKAALTYEWSNGQVEGQVNRLKFIKRQMYGRANFDLLRKRVLGMPLPT
jgi:transposase